MSSGLPYYMVFLYDSRQSMLLKEETIYKILQILQLEP